MSADGTRVGFVGLGSQGSAMARRIAEEGFPLALWARRPATLEPFADTRAVTVGTLAELGARSDVVGVCVTSDADVEQTLLGEDGVLSGMTGGVILIHSTIHPETCRRVAEQARTRGVAVVDAPVSGGGGAAAQRALLVMVGGADEDIARCRPVLESFANPLLHLGPLGSGLVAKALNNYLLTVHIDVATQAFAFAQELGLARPALGEVLTHGSGGSRAASIIARSGFQPTGLRGAVPLLTKDCSIVLDLAAAAGVQVPDQLQQLSAQALRELAVPATPSPEAP